MNQKILLTAMIGILIGMVGLQSSSLFAQDQSDTACQEAKTVFQDVSVWGRKNRAAKNITRNSAEFALQGWKFSDMEIYTENGDLEGFYLTYVRDVSCQ